MKFRRLLAPVLGAILASAGIAFAAGIYTNGLPATVLPLTGIETLPLDTNLAGGQAPQTESLTILQLRQALDQQVSLTDASSVVMGDPTRGRFFTFTIGGNRTLANPTTTNLTSGYTWKVKVTQDTTGSHTLAYGTLYKWSGGTAPTLTATTGYDLLTFIYDGTNIAGSSLLNIH